jgi:hypothetical protein
LLVLLLIIFGSVTAASLPLAIGGLGILGSFMALRALTLITDVSIFSVNITTIIGLGLGIDYGLLWSVGSEKSFDVVVRPTRSSPERWPRPGAPSPCLA